jgi:hypothetical protein
MSARIVTGSPKKCSALDYIATLGPILLPSFLQNSLIHSRTNPFGRHPSSTPRLRLQTAKNDNRAMAELMVQPTACPTFLWLLSHRFISLRCRNSGDGMRLAAVGLARLLPTASPNPHTTTYADSADHRRGL